MDRAIDANVANVVERIAKDSPLAHLIEQGQVSIVGGRYDLETGKFSLLDTAN